MEGSMKISLRQKNNHEKAHRIRAGLSNILIIYVLAGAIQLTKLANGNNSISCASDVIGGE